MRKNLILTAFVLIFGVGLAAAGYCVACRFPGNSETRGINTPSGGSLGPIEVVQEYAIRSASCGALKLDDLTWPIPDEDMSLIFHEDQNYLEKKYETADGLISLADNARPIYLKFITEEFPQYLCENEYSLGRIFDVETEADRASVKVDFVDPAGSFGSPWKFNLIKNESGWRAFYLEGPGNKKRRIRLPIVTEIKTPKAENVDQNENRSKARIRARP